jgi:hypothetical protein
VPHPVPDGHPPATSGKTVTSILKVKSSPAAPPAMSTSAPKCSGATPPHRVVLSDRPVEAPEGCGARPLGIPTWGEIRKSHPKRGGETKSAWNLRLRGIMADRERDVKAAGAAGAQ